MTDCSPKRFEIIRDELVWDKAVFLQKVAHQFQRRPLVPPGNSARYAWKSSVWHRRLRPGHSDSCTQGKQSLDLGCEQNSASPARAPV
jgi:hypothetical protein